MDPDREALRKAIGVGTESRIYGNWFDLVLDAARRDLARLEAEKPKRASLGELVDGLAEQGSNPANEMSWRNCLNQAAAVLRAVGELKRKSEATGMVHRTVVEEFLRSLP